MNPTVLLQQTKTKLLILLNNVLEAATVKEYQDTTAQ